ncbi:MAG: hypothetical protein ACQCN6_00020 [Candidatus Bathyarchaeia archaeon]|jgi:hypothetical protein
MPTVGFDSITLKKDANVLAQFLSATENNAPTEQQTSEQTEDETAQQAPKVIKSLLGVSVSTSRDNFNEEYLKIFSKVLSDNDIDPKRPIYKGAHLLKQAGAKTEEIITEVMNQIEPFIDHIDVYSAFYDKEFISIFGKAQGQRIDPAAFVDLSENSFAHICAWWYWRLYNKSEVLHNYQIDHFQGRVTPAWRELESSRAKVAIFYNGSECNPLISLADLLLKLIEIFHFGAIDYRSVVKPLHSRCNSQALYQKIRSHNLARYDWMIHNSVPDTPLDINVNKYLKHPIYFIAWSPTQPRKMVKISFEWSLTYNSLIKQAIENNGCIKFLDFDKDFTFCNETDQFVPINNDDENHLASLNEMGFDNMPKILRLSPATLNNRTS